MKKEKKNKTRKKFEVEYKIDMVKISHDARRRFQIITMHELYFQQKNLHKIR